MTVSTKIFDPWIKHETIDRIVDVIQSRKKKPLKTRYEQKKERKKKRTNEQT